MPRLEARPCGAPRQAGGRGSAAAAASSDCRQRSTAVTACWLSRPALQAGGAAGSAAAARTCSSRSAPTMSLRRLQHTQPRSMDTRSSLDSRLSTTAGQEASMAGAGVGRGGCGGGVPGCGRHAAPKVTLRQPRRRPAACGSTPTRNPPSACSQARTQAVVDVDLADLQRW